MIVMISSLLVLFSCDALDKTQKQWTDGPETIYVGRLDSLYVRSGIQRVEIVGNTRFLRTATTCKVTYDDQVEIFNIDDIVGKDGHARILVGHPEDGHPLKGGSYFFNLTTHDDDGNRSIVSTVFGEAYDPSEADFMYPAEIVGMAISAGGNLKIQWEPNDARHWKLEYIDAQGNEQSLELDGTTEYTELPSWKRSSKLEVTSYVLKKETDLDEFALSPKEYSSPSE